MTSRANIRLRRMAVPLRIGRTLGLGAKEVRNARMCRWTGRREDWLENDIMPNLESMSTVLNWAKEFLLPNVTDVVTSVSVVVATSLMVKAWTSPTTLKYNWGKTIASKM